MKPSKKEWREALIERYGKDIYTKIASGKVAVCGLGGLGSHIAIMLARAGVETLILIDFDRVDITNLHRQQYKLNQIGMYKTEALSENIKEIAPFTEIKAYTEKLDKNNYSLLLKDADIICEAFDDSFCKAELINLLRENFSEKYVIASSGMSGFGDANIIHTRKVSKRFYLCGDEVSDVSDGIGLVATRVMLCAAHQAHKALQILLTEEGDFYE